MIHSLWATAQKQGQNCEDHEGQIARWQKSLAEINSQLQASALELSKIRLKVAATLEDVVLAVLADLGMQSSRLRSSIKWELASAACERSGMFVIKDQKHYALKPHGLDNCEILLGHQTGFLRPLAKIA